MNLSVIIQLYNLKKYKYKKICTFKTYTYSNLKLKKWTEHECSDKGIII